MPTKCACGCGDHVQTKGAFRASCAKRLNVEVRDPSGKITGFNALHNKRNNPINYPINNPINNPRNGPINGPINSARKKTELEQYRKRKREENGHEQAEPTMNDAEIEMYRVMHVHPLIESIDAIADEICIGISGMSNGIDGFDRVRQHYPSKHGWANNGSKKAKYDPIRAAIFYNPENIRKLEDRCIKHYHSSHNITNDNNVRGGPLGIKTKNESGETIYEQDPLGYFLYIVYKRMIFLPQPRPLAIW
jgi:hypothetical protein